MVYNVKKQAVTVYRWYMRIGFLGGSFNPLHNGHIEIARQALKEFSLDKVLFIVAADPPHKEIAGHVSAVTRFQMLRAGLYGLTGLEASDIELHRTGKSYTFDTVELLKERCHNAELFCIVGADMLFDLPNWHRAEELLKAVSFLGFKRGGENLNVLDAADMLKERYGARVLLAQQGGPAVSSTEIRRRVYEGESVFGLLPENAERFLYENGLYLPGDIRAMQEKLRSALNNEERYEHTMGTVRAAARLAERSGVCCKKARLAALLHDCAKVDREKMAALLQRLRVCPIGYALKHPGILHGPVGAELARLDYGVLDAEVLLAIYHHTTCAVNMSTLDKIIFIADKTEPTRAYQDVGKIRQAAEANLDEAVLLCLKGEVLRGSNRERGLAPSTLYAKDDLEKTMNKQKKKEAYH